MYGISPSHISSDRLYAQLCNVAAPADISFLAEQFDCIPSSFHKKLFNEYAQLKKRKGRKEANLWSFGLQELFGGRGLNYAADDAEIVEAAENAARNVRGKLPHCTTDENTLEILGQVAARYDIELPKLDKISKLTQRMSAEKWWRKQLRKRFNKIEAAAIRTGFVHKRAGLYASDETVNRRQKQKRKNARLLENLEAIHDQTGEVRTLAELAATNVSNPAIRRAELMTRIRGIEELSNLIGYVGLFLTLTTPSRMHARLFHDGTVNPKYDNIRPDYAQRYLLNKVWAPVRAKLQRDGIDYFGVRIVEPHHDGTPHWHMLVFVKPEHQEALTNTLREYALRDSPEEPGAQERRFIVKQIDPNKGSAAGYVAKYIAKNIDGFAVGDDYEADTYTDTSETSVRVEAWASLWHIRQFQFFGTPSVTPYRELRRLESLPESLHGVLGEAFQAADTGDWHTYMKLHRGGLHIKPLWEERPSTAYPDEITKRVRGVIVNGEFRLTTREGEWLIREKESAQRGRLFTPWTCVNNCTRGAAKGFARNSVPASKVEKDEMGNDRIERYVKRREPPRTRVQLTQKGELNEE
ncbi:MAG TPA: replication endonuclease [Gallionellaceae bacterium]|nr:replication endonuclease [Gallionellaceae bacterium]